MAALESPQEQRVVLRNVSWEMYERLLAERDENQAPRFAYDRGMLEILTPLLREHEEYSSDAEFLVRTLAEELGTEITPVRAMTLKREDIEAGAEPDSSYYIQNEPSIRNNRRIDLSIHPPPDLVIEIDITSPSLNKLPIYTRFGVPEVWRYDGVALEIRVLRGDRYVISERSEVLSGVTADDLSELLGLSKHSGTLAWQRRVRDWAGEQAVR